jgi:hypothetical protein
MRAQPENFISVTRQLSSNLYIRIPTLATRSQSAISWLQKHQARCRPPRSFISWVCFSGPSPDQKTANPDDPGGPGAGKGTQCSRLARELDVAHVSIGDLLRAEQHQAQSIRAEAIRAHYHEGEHLDDQIYVDVLREHLLLRIQNGTNKFLVDGFPRNICQTGCFERRVVRKS